MKIGIVNSGGDAQGINSVISAAVIYGEKKGHEFLGFIKGWDGLLDNNFIELNSQSVQDIANLGGTILKTVNKGRFAGKVGFGNHNNIPSDILSQAKDNFENLKLNALIVIGGDGTLSAAQQLSKMGVHIVGIPKTIDNDIMSTDKSFGFNSAVDIAVEAIDRIRTTAYSHDRVIFVETMGRHAGWIALHSGIAGGADAILLPEFAFDYQSLLEFLRWRKDIGKTYTIVVCAEGAKNSDSGQSILNTKLDGSEVRLGGISGQIINVLEQMAPNEFDMRNVVLGHTQRGGSPNADDRILAKIFGTSSIDAIDQKKFGTIVGLKNNEIKLLNISDAIKFLKLVTEDAMEFKTAERLGIFMGKSLKLHGVS